MMKTNQANNLSDQQNKNKLSMLVEKVTMQDIVDKVALVAMKRLSILEERLFNLEILAIENFTTDSNVKKEIQSIKDVFEANVKVFEDTLKQRG